MYYRGGRLVTRVWHVTCWASLVLDLAYDVAISLINSGYSFLNKLATLPPPNSSVFYMSGNHKISFSFANLNAAALRESEAGNRPSLNSVYRRLLWLCQAVISIHRQNTERWLRLWEYESYRWIPRNGYDCFTYRCVLAHHAIHAYIPCVWNEYTYLTMVQVVYKKITRRLDQAYWVL